MVRDDEENSAIGERGRENRVTSGRENQSSGTIPNKTGLQPVSRYIVGSRGASQLGGIF